MARQYRQSRQACYFENFPALHGFTMIGAGNMSYYYGHPGIARDNRKRLFRNLNPRPALIVHMKAQHEDAILTVGGSFAGIAECDGLMTGEKGIMLSFCPADCFPVVFASVEPNFLALLHAGWKGIELGIISKAVGAAREKYGVDLSAIKAAVGPGILRCCFGNPNVACRESWREFATDGPLGLRVDLLSRLTKELLDAGIPGENLHLGARCTCCAKDASGGYLFFSHRRSELTGEGEGRIMAYAML